jgi:ribosomal protein L11 methyltransferase
MKFIQLDITTETSGVEPLIALLETAGLRGFVVDDSNDFTEFAENKGDWDYIDGELMKLKNPHCFITSYIPDDASAAQTLSDVRQVLDGLKANGGNIYGTLELKMSTADEQDWENNWKQYFKPFPIGKKLAVKPSWEVLPDELAGRKVIQIDPGSSFGTGQHASTEMCLEMLEELDLKGTRVLDLGCGSGILSVAAHLLGAEQIVMTDISPNSVNTAKENLALNGCTNFTAFAGDVTVSETLRKQTGAGFSVITANIIADVIIEMMPLLVDFAGSDTIVITSGIITERKSEVLQTAKSCGYIESDVRERGGWIACKHIINRRS